jgi:methionyl-tRNA formyltransferase
MSWARGRIDSAARPRREDVSFVRVVFLGNAPWSVPSLEALAASPHDLVLTITRAPRAAGRGNRPTPTPVAEAARRLHLPVHEVETVKSGSGFDALAEAAPGVLAVVAYGEILPKAVLDIPRIAPVNVHFSLLPELRGAAPVQRAILEGLDVTGVTTIRMDEGMDTGPILLQAEEPISPQDDAGSLGERLAPLGGRLLVEAVDRLEGGSLVERPQDEAKATYAPKVKPEDRVINWLEPADAIARRVRALAPEPGATTTFRGKTLKILRASSSNDVAFAEPLRAERKSWAPGFVVLDIDGGVQVVAGQGFVTLEEVAPEGRRRMSGPEFERGYRPGGEILG